MFYCLENWTNIQENEVGHNATLKDLKQIEEKLNQNYTDYILTNNNMSHETDEQRMSVTSQ